MVRHLHASFEVILNFLVQAPHLGHLTGITPNFVHNLFLGIYDRLQHGSLCICTHGGVVITTHADCDDVLEVLCALGTLFEELAQCSIVGGPTPGRVSALDTTCTDLRPLLGRADHRLGVRRAHDDTISVSERLVSWVVNIEHGVPHGRPEVVRPVPEKKFKNVRIETSAEGRVVCRFGVFRVDPASESRSLIVDEESTILHSGRLLDFGRSEGVDLGVGFGGNVSEEVPRGYTDLLGDVVEAVDGAALVAPFNVSESSPRDYE